MARPQSKHLRPQLEVLQREGLAGPALREGEISRPVRIRAPREVHEWLASMTAAQVGELLAAAMRAEQPAARNAQPVVQSSRQRGAPRLAPAQAQLLLDLLAGGRVVFPYPAVAMLELPSGEQRRLQQRSLSALQRMGLLTPDGALTAQGQQAAEGCAI